jgi:hypothetical protein
LHFVKCSCQTAGRVGSCTRRPGRLFRIDHRAARKLHTLAR